MLRQPQPQDQARILEQAFASNGMHLAHRQALDLVARLHGHKNWHVMSKAQRAEEQAPASWAPTVDPEREIALVWSVEDVFSVRPDLSEKEAQLVLREVHRRHDASLGVTWDTLEDTARAFCGTWYIRGTYFGEDDAKEAVLVSLRDGSLYTGVTLEELLERRPLDDSLPDGYVVFDSLPSEQVAVQHGGLLGNDTDALHELAERLREADEVPVRG